MALEYFLYTELYNNTLIDRSDTTFAPLPADTGQIYIDFLIPETQPLYLFKEDAGLIVPNNDANVNSYLEGTAPPIQVGDSVTQHVFTGYTATTDTRYALQTEFTGFTATTDARITNNGAAITINAGNITGNTADINTRVYRSGDTMTGSLSTSGNFTAVGAVTGSSVSASVLMTTPILNASTSVCAPQISGSTCMTAPITCGTTSVISPVLNGSTCVTTPTVCAGTCLCSVGTSYFNGGTTAASFLNVSGVTTFGGDICLTNPNTGGTLNDYGVKWDPITKQIRTIPSGTGGTANVYCYVDCRVIGNNITDVNAIYMTESWSLPSGYYEYEYNAHFGNNATNRCAVVCFLMDGSVVGHCNLMKTNDTNVIATAYVTQNNQLSGGTYTPSIVYKGCGGGVTSIYYGSIRVQKIGETS